LIKKEAKNQEHSKLAALLLNDFIRAPQAGSLTLKKSLQSIITQTVEYSGKNREKLY